MECLGTLGVSWVGLQASFAPFVPASLGEEEGLNWGAEQLLNCIDRVEVAERFHRRTYTAHTLRLMLARAESVKVADSSDYVTRCRN